MAEGDGAVGDVLIGPRDVFFNGPDFIRWLGETGDMEHFYYYAILFQDVNSFSPWLYGIGPAMNDVDGSHESSPLLLRRATAAGSRRGSFEESEGSARSFSMIHSRY